MLQIINSWTTHSHFASTFIFIDKDNYKRDLHRSPYRTVVIRQHWQTYAISVGDFVKLREELESEVKFYLQPYSVVQIDLRSNGNDDDLRKLNFYIKDNLLTGPNYLGRRLVYRPPLLYKTQGVYFLSPDDLDSQLVDFFIHQISQLGVHDPSVSAPVHIFKFSPPE